MLLKNLWFLFVILTTGISWMTCTFLMLGLKPNIDITLEQLFLLSLISPGYVFIMGSHLMWILHTNWLVIGE